MKKTFILVLVLLVCGCNSQTEEVDFSAIRRGYIAEHLAEIRRANRKLLVGKTSGLLRWQPSIEGITEKQDELMDVVIRAMCGEDIDSLVRELLLLAPVDEVGGEAAAELKAGLLAASHAGDPNMCGIFERAIARGNIVEGMTTEQVTAAWGCELTLLSSDSEGGEIRKASAIEQENYVLQQGRIVIASTTASMSGHSSDFYLEFQDGKLTDWTFVPHVEDEF